MGHGAILARLKAAFPRQIVDDDMLRVYLERLQSIPTPLLDQAVNDLIDTQEFFPTVARIKEACAERRLGLPSEAQALAQADGFVAWARLGGAESRPDVHPLVVEAVGVVGGWRVFRTAQEPSVVRAQLGRHYRELRAAAIRGAVLAPMLEAAS